MMHNIGIAVGQAIGWVKHTQYRGHPPAQHRQAGVVRMVSDKWIGVEYVDHPSGVPMCEYLDRNRIQRAGANVPVVPGAKP